MKQYIYLFILMLVFSCGKNKESLMEKSIEKSVTKTKKNTEIFYAYNYVNIGYLNRNDVGKDIKLLDNNLFSRIPFSTKILGTNFIDVNGEEYVFDNNEKIWISKSSLCRGFAVVSKNESDTYTLPENEYLTDLKLTQGDIGYIIRKYNGFAQADFKFYKENNEGNKVYVGTRWIKLDSVIDNIDAAKLALYNYYALLNYERGDYKNALYFITLSENVEGDFQFLRDSLLNIKSKITVNESEEE